MGVFHLPIGTIRLENSPHPLTGSENNTFLPGNISTCGRVGVPEASLDGWRWSLRYTFKKAGN